MYFIYSCIRHKGFSIGKSCVFSWIFPKNGHWNVIQWKISNIQIQISFEMN
jgi:hypothetical protein